MNGINYPLARLADAFATATTHPDAATRQRAAERAERWKSVVAGIVDGTLRIGSRTPVKGLPVWVTPEVVRGGFATGRALAELPRDAGDEFGRALTPDGLGELLAMLDGGAYRLHYPEAAALPVVAWLVRAGDQEAAEALLRELAPFAQRLRFTPWPADGPQDLSTVWRFTVGDVRESLADRAPNARVETMRTTLTVWNPYADELLELWLDTVVDDQVGARTDDAWRSRAARLVARYEELAAAHPPPRRHRDPKENPAILRRCAATLLAGREIRPRPRRLLEHAVRSMVARRGRPGSPEHTALRAAQAANAATPTMQAFARLLATRVAELPQDAGTTLVDELLTPVHEDVPDIPVGTEIPAALHRIVRRALAGTVPELVAAGVVPSAEVLAKLSPTIAALTVADGYPDAVLGSLMAANYLAFRSRRSLLLLNLQHQATLEELPWVRAVEAHRAARDTHATARALGGLVLEAFPGTVVPNPMVRELAHLAPDLPWVEELAADIFMGAFSKKFPVAARIAGDLLDGSLYARYYDLDFTAVADQKSFARWCGDRAGRGGNYVVANGMAIEQAQIVTTHNLATLVHAGVDADWTALAHKAFGRAARLARTLGGPRSLRTVKDIAYAWRQLVFFLSLTNSARAFVTERWADAPSALYVPLAGLEHVVDGGTFDDSGRGGQGRRLLGWSAKGHWLLT